MTPSIFATIASKFPLVVYPPYEYSKPPAKPTLWVLASKSNVPVKSRSPTKSNSSRATVSLSYDVDCLILQAYSALTGLDHDVIAWDYPNGGPGGKLPALHLPNGDLIEKESIAAYVSQHTIDKNKNDSEHNNSDDKYQAQAYISLIENRLRPALLAELALDPPIPFTSKSATITSLADLVNYVKSFSISNSFINNVKALTRNPTLVTFDHVTKQGINTLHTLASSFQSDENLYSLPLIYSSLFHATLFAYLYTIQHLDLSSPLRKELSQSTDLEPLRAWSSTLQNTYLTK